MSVRIRSCRPLYLDLRRCFIGMMLGCILALLALHTIQFEAIGKALLAEGYPSEITQPVLESGYTGREPMLYPLQSAAQRNTDTSSFLNSSLVNMDLDTNILAISQDGTWVAGYPGSKSSVTSTGTDRVWPLLRGEQNDRIQNQLQLQPLVGPPSTHKRVLVFTGYGSAILPGDIRFHLDDCLVRACSLSDDPSEAKQADAILFQGEIPLLEHKRSPNQIWILHLLESPLHTQTFVRYSNAINWTATYRRDSTIVTPYEKYVPYKNSSTSLPPRENMTNYAAGKTRLVAWFVSNCSPSNDRDEYVKELQKHIRVDVYGDCGSMHCHREDPTCFQMLQKTYKFYLAFENSNCRDYITEKFFINSLQHNVIPIVIGPRKRDYLKVAPPGSFIHVDDFTSPKELARYLHKLSNNDTLYNGYFDWKSRGGFENTKFWCRVCAMLHEAERTNYVTWYADFDQWWRRHACILPDTRRGHRWARWK